MYPPRPWKEGQTSGLPGVAEPTAPSGTRKSEVSLGQAELNVNAELGVPSLSPRCLLEA